MVLWWPVTKDIIKSGYNSHLIDCAIIKLWLTGSRNGFRRTFKLFWPIKSPIWIVLSTHLCRRHSDVLTLSAPSLAFTIQVLLPSERIHSLTVPWKYQINTGPPPNINLEQSWQYSWCNHHVFTNYPFHYLIIARPIRRLSWPDLIISLVIDYDKTHNTGCNNQMCWENAIIEWTSKISMKFRAQNRWIFAEKWSKAFDYSML